MKKIGITGHTYGLGKSLALYLNDYEVVGFSRSNGYDISKTEDRKNIIDLVKNFDIFINNAFYDMAQVDFLFSLHDLWKDDRTKTHVIISSNSGDGIKKNPHPYAIMKNAVDKTAEQLLQSAKYRIINVRPGYIDTPRVSNVHENKINPDELAKFIKIIIENDSFLISNITLLPVK